MLQTVDAIIEADGTTRLLEPIAGTGTRRASVTVLDDSMETSDLTALLSEPALAEDWNRPEEDAAWRHLQEEA